MRSLPVVWLLSVVVWTVTCDVVAEVWRESSFADFRDGVFNDGGANTYVSAKGRVQTVNRWDANGDGHIDLVFANSHPIVEALDMAIYWGNGEDFDIRRMSHLPSDGSQAVAAADFDKDGRLDLAMANYSNGSWTEMDSFVYYGDDGATSEKSLAFARGVYPLSRRISLPTTSAQGIATADLNLDGHPDIIVAQSAGNKEYRRNRAEAYRSPSRIFWGASTGFSEGNYLDLPAIGAADVAAGDLNGDGWPEVVFANRAEKASADAPSYIYWGSESGYSTEKRTQLPTNGASDVCLGDVNNDQLSDIVFANENGDRSFVYLNQGGIFSETGRIELATSSSKGCVVEDFDRDGFADVFFTNHQRHRNRHTESLLYYGSANGFGGAGSRLQAFPTIGAWGVSAADLNEDGWVDLVVCNHREHYSYEVPSFVFWNSPDGFDTSRRTPLYQHGATDNCIADFDGDGHLDIMICSFVARSRGDYDSNYVYWGNQEGQFSAQHRLELPGRESYEFALADFDDDGLTDLALTNSGEVGRRDNETWIFWNREQHFDPGQITGLSSYLSLGVQTADLDKDGYLDLVVQNFAPDPHAAKPGSHIYWGGEGGFVTTKRTTIPYYGRAPAIADLNYDGNLDIVCGSGMKRWAPEQVGGAIYWGDGTRRYGDHDRTNLTDTAGATQPEIADLDRDGYLDIIFPQSGYGVDARVLYGNKYADFNQSRRDLLAVESASNCSVADVDADGWLDIVFPSYKAEGPPVSRSTISRVWRGGPDGFQKERVVWLPTNSGTGSLVSDFNRDSHPDIFLYCHRKEGSPDEVGNYGDHQTDSYLYWGSSEGFDAGRRLSVPSMGVHNDSGVDIGHIANRGFQFEYVSSAHDAGSLQPVEIAWDAEEPHRTSISFQLRTADEKEELDNAAWYGAGGAGTFFAKPGKVTNLPAGRWIQYKAVLDTDNGATSPVLDMVEVHFE